jgi:membrane protein required for colicin V production
MASLNFVDIIILVIFALSIVIGFGRGLVSEVISLVALVAAFAVAIYFTTPLADYFTNAASIKQVVSQSSDTMGASTAHPASYAALAISFILLFVATIVVGIIVKAILNLAISAGGVGVGNRILGGIFGFVRGFLINLVIIFIVQLSPLNDEHWWQQSKFVPQFQPAVQWLENVISPTLANLKTHLNPAAEKVTTPTDDETSSSSSGSKTR